MAIDYFPEPPEIGNQDFDSYMSWLVKILRVQFFNCFAETGGNVSIDNGYLTIPNHVMFQVNKSGEGSDQSFNADTVTTVTWDTEIFDVNGDFASNVFTAPVDGKYFLSFYIRVNNIDVDASVYTARLNTSNRNYYILCDSNEYSNDLDYWSFSMSVIADLDASDTAKVEINQTSGANQSSVSYTASWSGFSGCLIG